MRLQSRGSVQDRLRAAMGSQGSGVYSFWVSGPKVTILRVSDLSVAAMSSRIWCGSCVVGQSRCRSWGSGPGSIWGWEVGYGHKLKIGVTV